MVPTAAAPAARPGDTLPYPVLAVRPETVPVPLSPASTTWTAGLPSALDGHTVQRRGQRWAQRRDPARPRRHQIHY